MREVSNQRTGAAIEMHRELGPVLLESTYEACLAHELNLQRIKAIRQKKQPIHYKDVSLITKRNHNPPHPLRVLRELCG